MLRSHTHTKKGPTATKVARTCQLYLSRGRALHGQTVLSRSPPQQCGLQPELEHAGAAAQDGVMLSVQWR